MKSSTMKRILTISLLILLSSSSGFAQNRIYKRNVINIYRRSVDQLNKYAHDYLDISRSKVFLNLKEYQNEIPKGYFDNKIEVVQEGYVVKGIIWKGDIADLCYEDLVVYGEVSIKARENRVKVEIRNLNYIYSNATVDGPKQGNIDIILRSKKCKDIIWSFGGGMKNLMSTIEKDFKEYASQFDNDEDVW